MSKKPTALRRLRTRSSKEGGYVPGGHQPSPILLPGERLVHKKGAGNVEHNRAVDESIRKDKELKHEPGWKNDIGKIRIELFPAEAIFGGSAVFTKGAEKYGERNWEKGMSWSRAFGAMMRHMWAWWHAQVPTKHNFLFGDLDAEWGMSHLWHAQCCLGFLIAWESRGMNDPFDDRPNHNKLTKGT